ncbi:TrkH family potassium uptake protein [Clostridiaceae bacterium 35-E11]
MRNSEHKQLELLSLHPAQVLVMGFALVIFIGAIILNLPIASKNGESIGFISALFTATSAVCVTGLVVVDTATHWTIFGQTVILLLIQIGGLGFMTITTLIAFILGKRISLRERLVMQEALNQFNIAGVVRLTRYVLITTFTIEGIAALILSTRFIPKLGILKGIGFGIFHAISAFCNAGFDLIGEFRSLTPYVEDPLINFVIGFLIIIGGLGFAVVLEIIQRKRFKKFSLHTKLVLSITAILLVLGFLVILLLEYNNPKTMGGLSIKGKLLSAMFHSITPRTAGFNTLPTDKLTMTSIFFTIILMFIGGSPAGTAGGVKTTTAGVLLWTIISEIRGKADTEVFKKRIPREIISRSLAIVGLAGTLVVLVTMLLSTTENGHSFLEIFFEVVSAFGTVGLSMGITPDLTEIGRILITITMFAGRVGPLTVALALASKKQKNIGKYKYPEEKVIVG